MNIFPETQDGGPFVGCKLTLSFVDLHNKDNKKLKIDTEMA